MKVENGKLKVKGLAIMKKHLRKILCGMICLIMMLSGVNVFASETSPLQIDWHGDYSSNSKPKLIVTFTTPANYVQQVTVVVYDGGETNPTLDDYIRITDTTVNERETRDITFTITDKFSNEVIVELKGNGYSAASSIDSATVYVIKPSEIPGLLSRFNNESNTTVSGALLEADNALQLGYSAENTANSGRVTKRIDIMKNIKTNDFNGPFSNLEDVRFAWQMSDIIAYITDTGSTASGLLNIIEENSEHIAVDKTNPDYVAYIDAVCQDILSYSSEYNNNNGVKSAKDLVGIINQYVGLRAVNAANGTTLYDVFEDYKTYFEIPAETLAKYNGFDRSNKDKVLRFILEKGFTKNSELVAEFTKGVNGINTSGTDPGTPPIIIPPVGGGNSSGASGPGGVSAPTQPTQPTTPATPTFIDVPSSHWAYPYVTTLASKKIISGYDDNTFRPNNNVTREEFVKMIVGATGLLTDGAECNFADIPSGAWYYDYIASAYSVGVVSGIDDTYFGVGRNITRQDVAVIAARIIQYLKPGTTIPSGTTLTDIDTVSDYARSSVKLLNGMGIINGFDDGSFMPHNALTRAEAATIISKLADSL